MAAFDYRQATEIREAFARHGVRYLFIGKSGAILLGYPDTTQDVVFFVAKSPENGRAVATALRAIGFPLTEVQAGEIERGKDFVQLRHGPFDRGSGVRSGRHRTVRRRVGAARRCRPVSGLSSRRHHQQQGRGQSCQGSREPATAAGIP
jgi:hypothetical protein